MKIFMMIVGIVILLGGLVLLLATKAGIVFIALGIVFIIMSRKYSRKKDYNPASNAGSVKEEKASLSELSQDIIEVPVVGFDYYQDVLQELLTCENEDYTLSARDFKEMVSDRCYQYDTEWHDAKIVPEPENEFDPNALAVYVGDVRIGYIGRKDQAKVNAIDEERIEVEVYGGNYKEVDYDEFGEEKIVSGSTPYKAMLNIYVKPKK